VAAAMKDFALRHVTGQFGGQPIAKVYTFSLVPLADIPPLIRKAVVAYQDPDFYERPLVGPLMEFALAAASNRRPSASSISLSVTRSCLVALSPECCKGIDRHIGNLVLMGRVVRALSRDRILEIYLNDTYFGRNAYGVASAAEAYFGKPLAELDIVPGNIRFYCKDCFQ